ncbi:MAG: class I SAM-dependent methyltransferase [Spirochaetota bacterium]
MSDPDQFQLHRIAWSLEKSIRYWDNYIKLFGEDKYFSSDCGESVLEYIERTCSLTDLVLDYGCGSGKFIEHLLRKGITCKGLDFSPESVRRVNAKWADHPCFRGVVLATELPTPLGDASFGIIFCLDMIEHVLDGYLESTFAEFARIVREGGILVVTTPNEEKLSISEVLCPDCGCLFHRYQHVRMWSVPSLRNALEIHGFVTIACEPRTFGPNPAMPNLRKLYRWLTRAPKPLQPHLVYVGIRKAR